MSLLLIKDPVQKTADAIAKVLDIDVIIVDSELRIVGNTYSRMVQDEINVHMESIVGETISSGSRQVFLDKKERERCQTCSDSERCLIGGVLSVPIFWQDSVQGAIGAIFKTGEVSDWVVSRRQGVVEFLENMAGLLSSKLESTLQIEQIEHSQYERELIIETISDALVFVDNHGCVVYRNSIFDEYFKLSQSVVNRPITSVVDHPTISAHLSNRRNVTDKIFTFENPERSFLGFITCRNIRVNGKLIGSIIIFKRIEEAYRLIHEISVNTDYLNFPDMIADSNVMQAVMKRAKEVAVGNENLIITGASGTGKQLIAGAIHRFSNRKDHNLLTVHCSTLSRSQYLSTFFGMGKNEVQAGEFQFTNGGTIVLLELCSLPLSIQKDLCDFMSKGEIHLENGLVVKNLDIRFIATSSDDLLKKVKSGDLLEDLYFRLKEEIINLPQLKERGIDEFRMFLDYYLAKFQTVHGKTAVLLTEAVEAMWRYDWPGNVKELSRVVEKSLLRSRNEVIDADLIEETLYSHNSMVKSDEVLNFDEYERQIYMNALHRYGGKENSKAIVAEKLGISRATLYRKIKKYNLDRN